MRTTLITGFLGSGKTTLLKRMLREHSASIRFGIIVNDLSELEVDGELIRMGHAVSEERGTLISLHNGSISDSKRLEFSDALQQMKQRDIDHVVVEASGGSHPMGIIEELLKVKNATLHAVITLVDARAMLHDYGGGPTLLHNLAQNKENGKIGVENLLSSQLGVATVIALTKVDMVAEKDLALMLNTLQALNPSAKLTASAYGKIDKNFIFNAPVYKIPQRPFYLTEKNSSNTEDYDIGSEVLHDPRPFHPQRLYNHYRKQLGMGIFRSKGFIWLASRPDHVLLWNQAGGSMAIELLGTWRAAILADPSILPNERKALQDMLASKHPVFGDRDNEITIIGHANDRKIFIEGLKRCLCTPAEVEQWQKGIPFEDPWPIKLRVLSE